eukprot:augustus_masked-scaffold_7-processed-gene-6.55-mRNA-1 protein AED:0.47 eAED:0.47 QI:0/-1/0/1/-1/1/1/0/1001
MRPRPRSILFLQVLLLGLQPEKSKPKQQPVSQVSLNKTDSKPSISKPSSRNPNSSLTEARAANRPTRPLPRHPVQQPSQARKPSSTQSTILQNSIQDKKTISFQALRPGQRKMQPMFPGANGQRPKNRVSRLPAQPRLPPRGSTPPRSQQTKAQKAPKDVTQANGPPVKQGLQSGPPRTIPPAGPPRAPAPGLHSRPLKPGQRRNFVHQRQPVPQTQSQPKAVEKPAVDPKSLPRPVKVFDSLQTFQTVDPQAVDNLGNLDTIIFSSSEPVEYEDNSTFYFQDLNKQTLNSLATFQCDPNFCRLSMNLVPSNPDTFEKINFPFVVAVQPFFKYDTEPVKKVSFTDFISKEEPAEEFPRNITVLEETEIHRCPRCRGYFLPNTTFCHLCELDLMTWKNTTSADNAPTGFNMSSCHATYEYVVDSHKAFSFRSTLAQPFHFFIVGFSIHRLDIAIGMLSALEKFMDKIKNTPEKLYSLILYDEDEGQLILFQYLEKSQRFQELLLNDSAAVFPFSQLGCKPTLLLELITMWIGLLRQWASQNVKVVSPVRQNNQTQNIRMTYVNAIDCAAEILQQTEQGGCITTLVGEWRTSRNISTFTKRIETTEHYHLDREADLYNFSNEKNKKSNESSLASDCCLRKRDFPHSSVTLDIIALSECFLDLPYVLPSVVSSNGRIYRKPEFSVMPLSEENQTAVASILLERHRETFSGVPAQDVIVKLRTSLGFQVSEYLGPGVRKDVNNFSEVHLSSLSTNSSLVFRLSRDRFDLADRQYGSIQLAVLYSDTKLKSRRLRIINRKFSLSPGYAVDQVFKFMEGEVLTSYLARKTISSMLSFQNYLSETGALATKDIARLGDARAALTRLVASVLSKYRRYCSSESSSVQLILPETLKLLPLFGNALLESSALRNNINGGKMKEFFNLPKQTALVHGQDSGGNAEIYSNDLKTLEREMSRVDKRVEHFCTFLTCTVKYLMDTLYFRADENTREVGYDKYIVQVHRLISKGNI